MRDPWARTFFDCDVLAYKRREGDKPFYRVGDTVRLVGWPGKKCGTVLRFVRDEYGELYVVLSTGGNPAFASRFRTYMPPKEPTLSDDLKRARKRERAFAEQVSRAQEHLAERQSAHEEGAAAVADLERRARGQGLLEPGPDNPLHLPTRYYDILIRRLAGETLASIARDQGVSGGRIRQIEQTAYRMLRSEYRRALPKRPDHTPLWNAVFGGDDWQLDGRYNHGLDRTVPQNGLQ